MKNNFRSPLLFLIALVAITGMLSGCLPGWAAKTTPEDTTNNIVAVQSLLPPLWLRGLWVTDSEQAYEVEFTSTSVIVTAMGSRTDYGPLFMKSDPNLAMQETTDSSYTFVIQPSENAAALKLMFTKISDSKIRHTIQIDSGIPVGPFMLYRPGQEPSAAPPPAPEPPPSDPPPSDPPPSEPPSEEPPVEDPPAESDPEQIEQLLNPPTWILGMWNSEVEGDYDVEFTRTTFIVTALDFPLDYGQLYAAEGAEVNEQITEDLYSVEVISTDGGLNETFVFEKRSSSTISHRIERAGGLYIGPITLYRPGQDPIPESSVPANDTCEAGEIDINTAPVLDLTQILHIDTIRAAEIIKLRPFSSVSDLERVTGITGSILQEIIEEGKVCASEATTPPANTPPPPPADPPVSTCEFWQVDLNLADREDMIQVIFIEEHNVDAVISLRPIEALEDLSVISGIDATALDRIQRQGVACISS